MENEYMETILQALNDMRQEFSERCDRLDAIQAATKNEIITINISSEKEKEIAEMKNLDEFQHDSIRSIFSKNNILFDRLRSEVCQNRAELYSLKADICELNEQLYLLIKASK